MNIFGFKHRDLQHFFFFISFFYIMYDNSIIIYNMKKMMKNEMLLQVPAALNRHVYPVFSKLCLFIHRKLLLHHQNPVIILNISLNYANPGHPKYLKGA